MEVKDCQETTSTNGVSKNGSVSFVITGFGKFGGITSNPTEIIVEHLLESSQREVDFSDKEKDEGMDYTIHTRNNVDIMCRVIKVAASSVTAELDEIYKSEDMMNRKHVVFIHLGVNYKGETIQLETTAFNEASFRIPDEDGYQPKKTQIDESVSLAERLSSSLNIRKICTEMMKKGFEDKVKISGDPGRFVCNYIYWLSLNRIRKDLLSIESQENSSQNLVHAIFVHVPPFTVIDEDTQFDFIDKLLDTIEQVVLMPKKKRKSKKKKSVE
jgi:pyroglutamyl-peptidase